MAHGLHCVWVMRFQALRLGSRLALFGAGVGIAYWQLQGRFVRHARYRTLVRRGAFELRQYEPLVRAETAIIASDWTDAMQTGFQRLAHYVFGGNHAQRRIAMTAPVTQSASRVPIAVPATHATGLGLLAASLDEREPPATPPGAVAAATHVARHTTELAYVDTAEEHAGSVPSWIMSFTMPSGSTLASLPIPDDARVRLRPLPERRIAALRFSGRYTPLTVGDKARELSRLVERAGLRPRGVVEFAGYDPPSTLPFLRRNEVWVEVAA
jgi:hypothetical protein